MFARSNTQAAFLALCLTAAGSAAAEELPLITTAELQARCAKAPQDKWDFFLIDARTRVEFEEGHIAGAANVPAEQTAAKLPALVKDKAATVVFYCNGPRCTKSRKAAKAAIAAGYTSVLEYNEGLPAWGKARLPTGGSPLPAFEAPALAAADLKAQLDGKKLAVIDIRDGAEFDSGHLAGALKFPLDELSARAKELPAGAICIVDHAGHQTAVAARVLAKLGHKDLKRLDGGLLAWRAAGLPIEGGK